MINVIAEYCALYRLSLNPKSGKTEVETEGVYDERDKGKYLGEEWMSNFQDGT